MGTRTRTTTTPAEPEPTDEDLPQLPDDDEPEGDKATDAAGTDELTAEIARAMGTTPAELAVTADRTGLIIVPKEWEPGQVSYLPIPAPPVHVALARVIADLPGIPKGDTSPEGYQYRGIEAITRHAQAAFGRHGIVIYPVADVVNIVQHDELAMNAGWREYVISVTWHVIGPAGDRLDPCPVTWGQGRDKADKSMNKAMTQAYKYLLLQLLCVGDQKDDPDSNNAPAADQYREAPSGRRGQQAQGAPPDRGPDAVIERDTFDRLRGRIASLPSEAREWLTREWTAATPMEDDDTAFPCDDEGKPRLGHLPVALVPAVEALIERARQWHKTQTTAMTGPAPADAPQTGPAPDAPAAPADGDEAPAETTTWEVVIGEVRSMTEEDLTAALAAAELHEEGMDPVKMRALLTDHLGKAAGLDIADYKPATAGPTTLAEPEPTDDEETEEHDEGH